MSVTGKTRWTPWLVRMSVPSPRIRLFCFPYAGGSAFNFTPWRPVLDSSIEICAVQLPGRGARMAEPPIASMSALIRQIAPVITQENDLPVAFFGHSLGALVAFELARYLRLHGLSVPGHLFVSGCQAPQYRSPSRQLHQLADEPFVEELRIYNGTPPEVLENRELMELLLGTIRADFALAENYQYRSGPALLVPISVFAGAQDDNKAPGQVDGWKKETANDCRVTWFEGAHFFIDTERHAVLKQLNTELLESPGAAKNERASTSR